MNNPRWSDLPPELIGRLSTFLELSEARNLLLTSGQEVAANIKKSYLHRNVDYLVFCLDEQLDQQYARRLANINAWLEVNHDWRELYDDNDILRGEDRMVFLMVFDNVLVACRLGLVDIVRHLVEVRGKNLNVAVGTSDRDVAYRPLWHALTFHQSTVLEYMLALDSIEVNYVFEETLGATLLHFAAAEEKVKAEHLRLLLSHNDIDANARDNTLKTPLHYVCRCLPNESPARVRHLLDAGADPNASDSDGMTPWGYMYELWGQMSNLADSPLSASIRKEVIMILESAGARNPNAT